MTPCVKQTNKGKVLSFNLAYAPNKANRSVNISFSAGTYGWYIKESIAHRQQEARVTITTMLFTESKWPS